MSENTPVPDDIEPSPTVEVIHPDPPEKIEEAERLIRDAQIAKMRGEKTKATRLLEEASAAAPNSPAVQEALGDAFAEKREPKKAMAAYKRALDIQPDNANIERKYAEMVLAAKTGEDFFLASQGGNVVGRNDVGTFASGKSAVLLSVILPGLGHIISGDTIAGIGFMVGFGVSVVIAILLGGFGALFALLGRITSDFSGASMVWLFLPLGAYLWCQLDMASRAKRMEPPKIDRPVPPVDKPF